MTRNLEMYIRIGRHRIHGEPLKEEDQMERERTNAIDEFKVHIIRLIDFDIRTELFFGANWSWRTTGPYVQFTIDGRSFLLAKGSGNCHLFVQGKREDILLTTLSDDDEQFADHLLVALGDAL